VNDPGLATLTSAGLQAAALDLAWGPLEVLASTGSTNADVLRRAEAGASEGLVIAADEQTEGRGRLGRSWVSPPGASVSVSVLLRPALTGEAWGWLPLITGLAVAAGIAEATGLDPVLKWPNDVIVTTGRPGKVAGVLVERAGTAASAGFGINTAMAEGELPVPEASSLLLAGARDVNPDLLVASCLRQLRQRYARFVASGGESERSGLALEYAQRCSTLGRDVVVQLPSGQKLSGRAQRLDATGRLCVVDGDSLHAIAAGDVTHLR
jgi:BirA family transcriptional regulator, biotin operon repressor / biotin---[acetyl-CoA-carboxylase] ligase